MEKINWREDPNEVILRRPNKTRKLRKRKKLDWSHLEKGLITEISKDSS